MNGIFQNMDAVYDCPVTLSELQKLDLGVGTSKMEAKVL